MLVYRKPNANATLRFFRRRSHIHYRAADYADRMLSLRFRLVTFHGPEDSGKSYLLDCIANALAARQHPNVPCLSGPNLVFVAHHAEHHRYIGALGLELLSPTVLLLDDLDSALMSKPAAFVLSDVLTQRWARGRPTVVTMRSHPLLMKPAVPDFTPRLAQHSVCELAPLDLDTRMAVAVDQLRRSEANIDMDVLRALITDVPPIEDIVRYVIREFLRRTKANQPPTMTTLSTMLAELDIPRTV